tara:strand:+ start:875 stop:1171 length:297 start_codon:yes stop_codon:yes gene_type:complete
MIKLTEIKSNAGQYNSETRSVDCSYSLKSIYINPKFIISMTDNEKYNSMHKQTPVIEGLIPEAKFTRLVVGSGTNGHSYYDVLGPPEQLSSMLVGDIT